MKVEKPEKWRFFAIFLATEADIEKMKKTSRGTSILERHPKFEPNRSSSFRGNRVTDRQTDRQAGREDGPLKWLKR